MGAGALDENEALPAYLVTAGHGSAPAGGACA
jgi:hypothetical protein